MKHTECRERAWQIPRSEQDVTCYGRNPRTDDMCLLGQHRGRHRDNTGEEWLDDGDLARPDWLDEPSVPRD